MQQTIQPGRHAPEHVVQWVKGWTPWGTPCSVQVVDGQTSSARSSEKYDCPLGRLATAQRERLTGSEPGAELEG